MTAQIKYLFGLLMRAMLEEVMPREAGILQTLRGAMESSNPIDRLVLHSLIEVYDNNPHMTLKDVEEFSNLMEGRAK